MRILWCFCASCETLFVGIIGKAHYHRCAAAGDVTMTPVAANEVVFRSSLELGAAMGDLAEATEQATKALELWTEALEWHKRDAEESPF